MRALLAPLSLVWARGRRRPGRWLPAVLGLAVAAAFGCGVAGEATIAGDQAARAQLSGASGLARTVRLTAQGPGSVAQDRAAQALLAAAGIRDPTRVVLLNPVRLSGVVVRPAARSRASSTSRLGFRPTAVSPSPHRSTCWRRPEPRPTGRPGAC